jgi:pimeloyl-ACP methyl ester carboxylesterase
VSSVASDGVSAVAVVFQTSSDGAVSLALSSSGTDDPVGSLTAYTSNYLVSAPETGQQAIPVVTPVAPCPGGPCTYVALYWPPAQQPVPDNTANILSFPVTLTVSQSVTASQPANSNAVNLTLIPPPVVLVHGIWAKKTDWSPLATWLANQGYETQMITVADYERYNYLQFADSHIQGVLTAAIRDSIYKAATLGVAARTVDVVAHSMGGLATRYLMENPPAANLIPANPVHKLITVATPFDGSALATQLWNNVDTPLFKADPVLDAWCAGLGLPFCTLGSVFKSFGKQVDSGVLSLEPGVTQNYFKKSIPPHSAIAGLAPTLAGGPSATELALDFLIGSFVPGKTVANILDVGDTSDTIVTTTSQLDSAGGQDADSVIVSGVVHAPFCVPVLLLNSILPTANICADTSETQSFTVWQQILKSLESSALVGQGETVAASSDGRVAGGALPRSASTSSLIPVFDLSGYTLVPLSNATISLTSSSTIALGSPISVTATSATKSVSELLVLQDGQGGFTPGILYATESPFTVSFTPSQLGSGKLVLFALFTDNTYTTTSLSYSVTTSESVADVRFPSPPIASLYPGQSLVVDAVADYQT